MKLSRPVVYLALVAFVAIIGLWLTGPPEPAAGSALRKKPLKLADAGWDFPPQDPFVPFAKPRPSNRNVFSPLVQPEIVVKAPVVKDDVVQIPASLADGEANWAYTGMAEVDGVRMALLENSTKRQSGYVREGEAWKKSRVVGISVACIVLADEKGATETVFRFNPNDPPKIAPIPDGGFRPIGTIGGDLLVRPLMPPPPPRAAGALRR